MGCFMIYVPTGMGSRGRVGFLGECVDQREPTTDRLTEKITMLPIFCLRFVFQPAGSALSAFRVWFTREVGR